MTTKILAVVVRGGVPKAEEIGSDLPSMKALVHGWIEHVTLRHPDFVGLHLWVNEEGMLESLPTWPQPLYPGPLYGDYFVTRMDEDGEATSLRPENVAIVLKAYGAM